MKLQYMPYAQANVIRNMGTVSLISYSTLVATISNNWLTVNGLYSATTRRHIMAFVREYAPNVADFKTIKTLVEDGLKINIETGEVEKIA